MKTSKHNAYYEQVDLFLDEHKQWNGALQDFQALRLEDAKNGLEAYRDLFPRSGNAADLLLLVDFLRDGLKDLPAGDAGAAVLCRLWSSFEAFAASRLFHDETLLSAIRQSLFLKAAEMFGPWNDVEEPFLPDQTPVGYVYLMAGQWDHAIQSLQAALPQSPQNAHIYGYLGDAYRGRGDSTAARSCYLEAFLIDPEAIDWNTFRDAELLAMKRRLQDEEGMDAVAALHWLPSYACIAGLFRPKEIRQLEVMKVFVEDYLQMERQNNRNATMALEAGLFIRAIILCDNEAFLRMVKGIDFADIRRRMKELNAKLFDAYMEHLKNRSRPRSEQKRY